MTVRDPEDSELRIGRGDLGRGDMYVYMYIDWSRVYHVSPISSISDRSCSATAALAGCQLVGRPEPASFRYSIIGRSVGNREKRTNRLLGSRYCSDLGSPTSPSDPCESATDEEQSPSLLYLGIHPCMYDGES